jgi:hypothetical protein
VQYRSRGLRYLGHSQIELAAGTHLVTGHIAPGFVREIGPQLFATGDRGLVCARLMFVRSDRTWPLRGQESLIWAIDQLLVGADGPEPAPAVASREHRPGSNPMSAVQSRKHPRSLLTSEIKHLLTQGPGKVDWCRIKLRLLGR